MVQEYVIHGLDEAGKIGDRIIFSSASTSVYNEFSLMLRNLRYFHKLILNKNDISGYDQGTLLKFVSHIIDDEAINLKLYFMDHALQNKLLSRMYYFLSNRLFMMRGELIKCLSYPDNSTIQRALSQLACFKRKAIYAESFVKSYGMKKIVEKIGIHYMRRFSSYRNLAGSYGPRIDIQIDGGFPFAFWWRDILDDVDSGLVKGKCLVTGITNGDSYYPLVSLAGTISTILSKYPQRIHMFPRNEIEFQPKLIEEEIYYYFRRHASSLSKPVYDNRLLMIGNFQEEFQKLIPYVYHLKEDRKKTYEPFKINTSIENFMKDFGYGNPQNTRIIVGNISDPVDRQNIIFSKERDYTIDNAQDLKDDYEELFRNISDEIDLSPHSIKTALHADLSKIRVSCLSNLQ